MLGAKRDKERWKRTLQEEMVGTLLTLHFHLNSDPCLPLTLRNGKRSSEIAL